LFYVLFLKGCILEGWHGWFYALQRGIAEAAISCALIEKKLRAAPPMNTAPSAPEVSLRHTEAKR
jgi:hypothetical protein